MKKLSLFFLIVFGISAIAASQTAKNKKDQLYIGYSRMDITPPVGIKLAGYEQRSGPSTDIHDPLYARVLVMDINGLRTAFITCDLAGYASEKVLGAAKEKYNIPYVLISYSHTHSGPNIRDNENYAKSIEDKMIEGLGIASGKMFPAYVSAGSKTFPQLGYNRITGKSSDIALWRNPERIPYGPVDPEVGVMRFDDESGTPRIIMMMYACHAVVNHHTYDVSADYPGVATKKVEDAFGKNTMCMFIQGGAGNINPLFMSVTNDTDPSKPRTDYSMIDKMGSILATQVIETAKTLSADKNEPASLKVMADSLQFRGRFKPQDMNVHITTILLNNKIAIAAVPGEFFVQHQLYWKQNAEMPYPFFFGYTWCGGSSMGYVPDIRSASYGGYGANVTTNIEVGGGEKIMMKHLENLYRLRGILIK